MASDRSQRRVERLLDEADEAVAQLGWETVRARAKALLANLQRRYLLEARFTDVNVE